MQLRLILGDQLNQAISSLSDCDPDNDVIMLCEVYDEATYVKHHKKKIALIFSAMRHFAAELQQQGFQVHYSPFDAPGNGRSFSDEVQKAVMHYQPASLVVTEPGEYRVLKEMQQWQAMLGIPVEIRQDDRFLCSHAEFAHWADGRKQFRLEYFYREMRRKHQVLMAGNQPEGGKWNFDSQNRKTPGANVMIPLPTQHKPDEMTQEVLTLVATSFADHFGDLEPFHFAVTRAQALKVLDEFIAHRLPLFGDYQDAMVQHQPWMFHSHLSFYLNCGLLLPLECVRRAEEAFYQGLAPVNAVEGFIRQIIGWREYVRGIYWLKMPNYETLNFLEANRPLPDFFWDADTDMNCLKQCITETRENAYAHHIQRLMVLGNFSLIAGLAPQDVNNWYLLVYADAYQWVELPNVTGMILFADGGELASKPYAASGAYINKMSDYCEQCRYKVKEKNGPDACPFNYLYWDFLIRNQQKLRGNPRLNMSYNSLDRMSEEKFDAVQRDSLIFFTALNNHEKV